MPKAPDLVPSVELAPTATPNVSVPTNFDMFGGNVANSLNQLGRAIEGAGDELFKRAVALQMLDNDAAAKAADADFINEASALQVRFRELQGKNATAAFPKYQEELRIAREKIRESLPNDYTRKLFDSSSRQTLSRSVFNGASYASVEQRKYLLGQSEARREAYRNYVLSTPEDEGGFKRALQVNSNEIRETAAMLGWSEEQIAVETFKANSALISARIQGLSKTKPVEALNMMGRFRDQLTEPDYLRLENSVRNQNRAVGAINIVEEIYDPKKTYRDMEDEARRRAKAIDPDDPKLVQNTIATLNGYVATQNRIKREQKWSDEDIIYGKGFRSGATTIQQLRADPEIAAAIDRLPPKEANALQAKLNNYNRQQDIPVSNENYRMLRGLYDEDRLAFMDKNPADFTLTPEHYNKIMSLREAVRKNADRDPQTNRAFTDLMASHGAALRAVGVVSRAFNEKNFLNFKGALSIALEEWQAENGKPPNSKDLTEVVLPRLLHQVSTPRWWGTSKTEFFRMSVPSDIRNKIKAEYKQANRPEPREDEIQRKAQKMLYEELWPRKGKSQAKPPGARDE